MELQLTNEEAQQLIKVLKFIINKHNIVIDELKNTNGEIKLINKKGYNFILSYKYSVRSKVFNLRELHYNYTLIRINLNNSFHKNSDGTKVFGNRVNIFSEEEFYKKADGQTHMITYPLPYESISNSSDFLEVFSDLVDYINIDNKDKLNVKIQNEIIF